MMSSVNLRTRYKGKHKRRLVVRQLQIIMEINQNQILVNLETQNMRRSETFITHQRKFRGCFRMARRTCLTLTAYMVMVNKET
jgi:hypothetical protein